MSAGEHEGSDTHRALLQTALDLLIESGGAELPSIKAVCARLGHTRSAFYSRFESRDEFVIELLDWVLSEVVGTVFAAAESGAAGVREVVERLDPSMGSGERQVRHDVRASYLAVMAALRTEPTMQERHAAFIVRVIERLAAGVRDGQRAGEFRSDVDPHHAATILVLVAVSAILWGETDLADRIDDITDALLRLLAEPPRR